MDDQENAKKVSQRVDGIREELATWNELEKEVKDFTRSLKHKYGINFSPIVLPMRKFIDIKKENPEYKQALTAIIFAHKEFAQNVSDSYQKEIQELENELSSL